MSERADEREIERAAAVLRAGGLVAFPTETVYGLGADATNAGAVEKIFRAKGRPPTNPLIVHVADAAGATRYASTWPQTAQRLAAAFWPGPLTLVLPRRDDMPAPVVPAVSAGLGTVGLRCPDHALALRLLRATGLPLAAPSANRSNRVSPTTAEHVRDELGDAVDMILDGGPCRVGIESTVLDLSGDVPAILRPGGVSREQLESVIGAIRFDGVLTDESTPASSPGQMPLHYAPATPAFRFDATQTPPVERRARGGVVAISAIGSESRWGAVAVMPNDPDGYARHMYRTFRDLDRRGLDAIYVEMPPNLPAWAAVRDRLTRATLSL